MIYRGTINIDFTRPDGNQQNRLTKALLELGWTAVETSAYTRDTGDLDDLWEGIGIVARQAAQVGLVSALTFHVQGAAHDFTTNESGGGDWPGRKAVADIKARKFPRDP